VRRTVRMRTTATALAVVGSALLVSAVALLVLLQGALVRQADERARLRVRDVAELARGGEIPPTLAGEDDGTVAQLVQRGQVVAQSPVIGGLAPLASIVPSGEAVVIRTVRDAAISDGGDYRVAAQRVDTSDGPAIVYAAASLEGVSDTMHTVQTLLGLAVPVLVLVVGFTTWRLVGRTLNPVEAIRRQVAEISATALDRRVPEPATGDEIERLARTMNEMLSRLDAAARRQRSFVADASHELRSPLATIRAKIEVGLTHPDSVNWPDLAEGWLAQQARLGRLVDDLLMLARLDEGVSIGVPAVVDLDELVLRETVDLQARGIVHVDVSGVAGGRVRGDLEQLRRVVCNLLDNAGRHAASTVRVELTQRGRTVQLVVGDDGPGIDPENRHRIFERFVRLDEARHRGSGGTGLGLAIVREIVTSHGGTVEAVNTDQGARLVVRLPAVENEPTPAD
jgi:signal transduction histidine kinase